MKFNWLKRLNSHRQRLCPLRRALPALSLASVLIGSSLWGQDELPRWHDPFDQPATSAAKPQSPVRFVWHDDEFDDPAEPNSIRPTAYQNQYPLSKDSEDLLPSEDHWRRLTIGEVVIDLVKPCARCVMVNNDPVTGRSGTEPLATLARTRKFANKVIFGQNALVRVGGTLLVGQTVHCEP